MNDKEVRHTSPTLPPYSPTTLLAPLPRAPFPLFLISSCPPTLRELLLLLANEEEETVLEYTRADSCSRVRKPACCLALVCCLQLSLPPAPRTRPDCAPLLAPSPLSDAPPNLPPYIFPPARPALFVLLLPAPQCELLQRAIEVALSASRLEAGIVSKDVGRAPGEAHGLRESPGSPGLAFRRVRLAEYTTRAHDARI